MRAVDDVGAVARGVALRAVWGLRAAGIPAGYVLALLGDSDDDLLAIVGVVSLALYIPAIALRFRFGLLGVLALVDVVLLGGAMAASGGLDSPVRLLLVPLPLVAALLLTPRGVLLHALTLVVALAVVGVVAGGQASGPAIALGFAALAAWLLATLREELLHELQEALARARDVERHERASARQEREQVAAELGRSAIDPIRAALDHAPAAELAAVLRAVSESIRAVVAELHALSARPIVLPSALARLGASFEERAGVPVTVEHRGEGEDDPEVDELVLAVARPVLREAVALPGAEAVSLCVVRTADGATVRVRVTGPVSVQVVAVRATLDGVRVRAEASGGSVESSTAPGRGEALVRVRRDTPADAPAPASLPRTTEAALRTLALCRGLVAVGLLGVPLLGHALSVPYVAILAVGGVWAALGTVPLLRGALTRERLTAGVAVDQLFVLALIAAAGDAGVDLAAVLLGVVALYGFLFGRWTTMALGVTGVGASFALTGAWELLPAGAWAIGLGGVLSTGRLAAEARGQGLARRSRAVVLEGLRAEEEERRTVARALHDEVLQLLLSARQDLAELPGRPEADAEARRTARAALAAIDHVSGRITLEPRVGSGDPARELPALLSDLERRGLPPAHLRVTPGLQTAHGPVVVALARELVHNVAHHAQAGHVGVRLEQVGERTILEVSDDGVGFGPERPRSALRAGHIGLATVRERAAAAGGIVHIASRPGQGTRVRVELPEPAPDRAEPPASRAPAPG